MKPNTSGFYRADDGRLCCRIMVPFHLTFEQLHLAASMVPGVTRDHEAVTVKQVSESLETIINSCGADFSECFWNTEDARGLDDEQAVLELNEVSYRNAYFVLLRLWPDFKTCPEARKYAQENQI